MKNNGFVIPLHKRTDGIWMTPENAVKYFRKLNGEQKSLGTLYNNLRSGKLQDMAYRDALGWLVFIPQVWIDRFNSEQNKVIPIHLPKKGTTQKSA
ncbi:MAG: hypothetical protein ACTHLB_14560 [Parafilimonas sp.]